MDKQTLSALAMMATVGFFCSVGAAAPPPNGPNNVFPPSFYKFNPGYYGPYYPGQYQYGNVQPSTYNNYRSPSFSGYGASGGVPLPFTSQPFGSPSTLGSTSSGSGSLATSPVYPIPKYNLPTSLYRPGERTTVLMRIHVPAANAQLWVEGWKTTSRGEWRHFLSPPLVPGERYVYEVRAQWLQNGHEVNRTRQVEVRAGEQIVVDFTRPESSQTTSVPIPAVGENR
jgi:uncharacterized protein (TIGR03000 family)